MTGQATVPPTAPAETVPSEETPTGRLARLARLQALQIIIVLAVIVVIFAILKHSSFLTVFNIRGIVQDTSILAVLGVGMTFVIVTGGIDLSVGSVLVFSGVVADKAMAAIGGGQGWGSALIGVLVAIGCGLGWGLLNGVLIARAKVPPLIVTLGTLGMALGLAEVITGGVDLRNVPNVMVNSVGFGNIFWQVPTLAVIAAVVIVIGIVALHRTRFGLHTYAIGSNPEAGRRSGLNVPGHLIMIYALSGLLAGFAGWLNLAFFQSTTIGGQSTTNLSVIAGTVIGGTSLFGGYGSILGTTIGLFIPTTLQNGFVIIGIQPFWQEVVVGAVLIAAVYVDQRRRAAALRGGRSNMHEHLAQSADHQQAGGAVPGVTPGRLRDAAPGALDLRPVARACGAGCWPASCEPHDHAAHPPKEQLDESRCLRCPGQFHDQGGPDARSQTGRSPGPGPANGNLRNRPAYPQRQILRRVPPDPRP